MHFPLAQLRAAASSPWNRISHTSLRSSSALSQHRNARRYIITSIRKLRVLVLVPSDPTTRIHHVQWPLMRLCRASRGIILVVERLLYCKNSLWPRSTLCNYTRFRAGCEHASTDACHVMRQEELRRSLSTGPPERCVGLS
jgi:hypothetical protein